MGQVAEVVPVLRVEEGHPVRGGPVSDRTRAERRVDALAAEARRLRAVEQPSKEQRARLWEIENRKLPSAWRAVNQMRDGQR